MSNDLEIIEEYNYNQSKSEGKNVLIACTLISVLIMVVIVVKTKTYKWCFFYIIAMFFIIAMIMYLSTNMNYFDLMHSNLINNTIVDTQTISKYFTIPDLDVYQQKVQLGYSIAKTKKIIILSLARDVEHIVNLTFNKLTNIGKDFQEYKIIIFENDSDDNTRQVIEKWTHIDSNIELMDCCNLNSCDCKLKNQKGYDMGTHSQGRMEKMRFYREYLLRYATQKYEFDYVMIYDFDISGAIYKDGLMTSFTQDFDMVFAKGLQAMPLLTFNKYFMYDNISFIPNFINFHHNLKLKNLHNHLQKLLNHNINSDFVKCKSGFNGMAIYKYDSIVKSTYMNSKRYCEHIDLHQDMYNKGYDKIYFNPNMILFIGQGGPDRSKFVSEIINTFNKKLD